MGGARPAFKLKSAVDDAGAGAQACQRLDDQRKATRELVARAAIEPHPLTILASNDAEAVMLDLVQPLAAGWQRVGFGGEARKGKRLGVAYANTPRGEGGAGSLKFKTK